MLPEGYVLKSKKQKNCWICQHPGMRQLDDDIYLRKMQINEVIAIAVSFGVDGLDPNEVYAHRNHLVLESADKQNVEQEMKRSLGKDVVIAGLDDTSDVTVVKAKINILRSQLSGLEDSGEVQSDAYIVLSKKLQDWMNLKNQLEGKFQKDTTTVDINLNLIKEGLKARIMNVKKVQKKGDDKK